MESIDPKAVDEARRCYAEELRFVADLKREEVVNAFSRVPREAFLGPSPWHVLTPNRGYREVSGDDPRDTYHNVLYALDRSRKLNNGQPSVVASMIDESGASPGQHVVHVGCGAGYYTAVLAEIVGDSGHVTAIEIDDDLAARARANLEPWPRVDVKHADGTKFDPGAAAAILVNAGAAHLAPLWLERLLPGATLIVPLTVHAPTHVIGQVLRVRHGSGGFDARFIMPVGIYPCVGARDDEHERRLRLAFQKGDAAAVRSLRCDDHLEGESCWLHTPEYCLSTVAP